MAEKDIDTVIKAKEDLEGQIRRAELLLGSFSTLMDKGIASLIASFTEMREEALALTKEMKQKPEPPVDKPMDVWDKLEKYAPAGVFGLLGIPDEEREKQLRKGAGIEGFVIKNEKGEVDKERTEKAKGVESALDLFALEEKKKNDILGKYVKERMEIRDEEVASLIVFSQTHAWAEESRANIVNSAYTAMQAQMLSLVETGRFSTEAFGEIIYQQVKMELVALSAKSAVQAMYYTALGFGLLAMSNPLYVAAFNAAAGFALISGATYGAAAGVQAAFWGQEEYAPPASSTGRRASGASLKGAAASSTTLAGYATDLKVKAPQNITIQIYNPLSEQNWQKIVEDNIVPAINSASERNIAITVKNMGG